MLTRIAHSLHHLSSPNCGASKFLFNLAHDSFNLPLYARSPFWPAFWMIFWSHFFHLTFLLQLSFPYPIWTTVQNILVRNSFPRGVEKDHVSQCKILDFTPQKSLILRKMASNSPSTAHDLEILSIKDCVTAAKRRFRNTHLLIFLSEQNENQGSWEILNPRGFLIVIKHGLRVTT